VAGRGWLRGHPPCCGCLWRGWLIGHGPVVQGVDTHPLVVDACCGGGGHAATPCCNTQDKWKIEKLEI
jgi:hypothetical protein